jgi:hypothetical protein
MKQNCRKYVTLQIVQNEYKTVAVKRKIFKNNDGVILKTAN